MSGWKHFGRMRDGRGDRLADDAVLGEALLKPVVGAGVEDVFHGIEEC